MKITVKRRHILEALRYNHLQAGGWFHDFIKQTNYDGVQVKPFNPDCSACLVGSTVRRAVPECRLSEKAMHAMDKRLFDSLGNQAFRYGLDICEESSADELVEKKLYLAALSAKFEGILRDKANVLDKDLSAVRLSKKERQRIYDWVKKHIPVEFTANLRKHRGY